MRIDARSRICGQPALAVRDLLRRVGDASCTVAYVAEWMALSDDDARALVAALERAGYVEECPDHKERGRWWTTNEGRALALATAAKPLRRATAEAKIKEFLERVYEVNRSLEFAYKVKRVILFGSMLTPAERVGDVDLAVELVPRETDSKRWARLREQRISEALARGRRLPTIVDQVCWPETEVIKFLKSRTRAISLHTTDDRVLERTKTKTIFAAEE